ncbi:hypothetical protein [Lentzea aerocolonigenes]|uniref:hypothetical protein n=1 Tax=Lentzea aerocolonigenes TaxID=68170 RepID=UPI0004C3BEE8|nr:hypothetical protein [Lentzea aerocolonigenes]MCP2243357.1 hypothetical protein [Lentzea aerocolonigenes]
MGCNNLVLGKQLEEVLSNPGNRANTGAFGEAIAEVFLNEVLGHEIAFDAASALRPQGIDMVTLNGETGRLTVVEVKATASVKSVIPRMGRTKDAVQMSDAWAGDHARAEAANIESVRAEDFAEGEGQVDKMVVFVNVAKDVITVHDVDAAGRVAKDATTRIGLSDLVRFVDALNADRAKP